MSIGKTIRSSYSFVVAFDHMMDSRSIAVVGRRYFDFHHSLFLYWHFHWSWDPLQVFKSPKKSRWGLWCPCLLVELSLRSDSCIFPYGDRWLSIACWRNDFKSSHVADWPVCLLIYCIWPLNDFDWVNPASNCCNNAPTSRPCVEKPLRSPWKLLYI